MDPSDHRNYKKFVALRLGEILENSDATQWRWIPIALNIADEATKWQKSPKFYSQSRWFTGPEFLRTSIENWPISKEKLLPVREELRPNIMQFHTRATNLIEISKFSSWIKLLRTQAFVNRFVNNTKCKLKKTQPTVGTITAQEYEKAENQLIQHSQNESYEPEIKLPKSNERITCKESTLYKLSAYLDQEKILRIIFSCQRNCRQYS